MAHIIVIGGHGKVALYLARILTGRGDQVSSVFRNPDHADEVAATGATPITADIEQLDTDALADLLAGHDAVVFTAGAGGGDPARTCAVDRDAAIRVIDAAAQAGVKRFVMVSYFGAGPGHGVSPENSFSRTPRPRPRRTPTCAPVNSIGPCWARVGSPSTRAPDTSRWAKPKVRSRGKMWRPSSQPVSPTTRRSGAPSTSTTGMCRSRTQWRPCRNRLLPAE